MLHVAQGEPSRLLYAVPPVAQWLLFAQALLLQRRIIRTGRAEKGATPRPTRENPGISEAAAAGRCAVARNERAKAAQSKEAPVQTLPLPPHPKEAASAGRAYKYGRLAKYAAA
ncbi:hypothetical protein HPB50_024259 [Hyalomma asiaticum]|uniref:Uncharacterized protein n=1 Tax=Hyalomma asiaticum TaxID=266040 RepID=A0ACB7S878_HYAAI|nr:hypothetical protein HPB50_024259 [Hyalomma asiaticum]